MGRSKNQLVNYCLARARLATIENLDTDQSSWGKLARTTFEEEFYSLLSKAPWNFATKRVTLHKTNERAGTGYYNFFTIPTDALFLWDIYSANESTVNAVNFYAHNYRYYYYSLPLLTGEVFLNGEAEVIGERIATNYSELWCFYTVNKDFSLNQVSQQFYDVLKLKLETAFMKISVSDEESITLREQSNDKKEMKLISQAGRENRKAHRVREADTITRLRQFKSGIY